MKNKVISVSITLVFLFISLISVDAAAAIPRIDLNDYEITVTDISNVYVSGTVSIAKGQNIGLFDSNGKIPLNYTTVKNSNTKVSFKIQVPATFLKNGTNTFKVISLPVRGALNASSPKTFTVTVNIKDNTGNNSALTDISVYQFADINLNYNLNCKSNYGTIKYSSSNSSIVSVNKDGIIKSKKPGTAVITVSDGYNNKQIQVTVPQIRNRVAALQPWHDMMVDTYKYIYARAYSGDNGKFWTTNGKWNGKTTKYGNRQSCITLPTTSLKRIGFLPKKGKSFWYDSKTSKNGGGKHEGNSAVKKLKKSSPYVTVTYPHKSYLSLIKSGKIVYGDIVLNGNKVNSGHTWIYMGQNPKDLRVFESGVERGIGGGAYVKWGFKNGNLHKPAKKTAKVKAQIKKTKALLKKYPASYFQGGNYQNNSPSKIHIVCHIKDFTVKTTCINGTITPSNRFMASQSTTIKYKPISGKKLSYIEVDSKKINGNTSSYTFKDLKASHSIKVVYK